MPSADVLLYLLVDLVIIIAAARTLGSAAKRIGQPAVIGEIVAGILLGPTVLGRFSATLPGRIFPADVPLRSIADLGLIFFMFLVGLELDMRLVRAQGTRALRISLSGVLLPLLGGILVGYLLYDVNRGGHFLPGAAPPPKTFVFALFLGASMCVTAFPVLARILVETGLYKTSVGTTALTAAAVDDVSAWVLLAAVVGVAKTGSALQAGGTFLLTLLFVALMATVGRRLLQLLARQHDSAGRLSVDQVAIVLAGVLLSAFVTEKIGIHAIFGAFIFGAIMPHQASMTRELTDKVEDFTVIVLLPVFFAVSGLRTNLFTLDSPALAAWLLLILAAAIGGKFLGCGLAARFTGSSNRDAVIIGSLMNTRGLTELVILSIGLSLGVMSDRIFAMMVIMALATTVMAAPIVNRLMPRERLLRELAGGGAVDKPPMATRVLVILGNPLNAQALVDVGTRLTGTRRPAELLLVRLIPTPRAPQFRSGLRDEEMVIAASVESMRELVERAAAAGVQARSLSFLTDDVTADLIRIATDQCCDVIVSGWHHASLDRRVIRASVHRIFRQAPCDVAVFVDRSGLGIQASSGRPVLAAMAGGGHDDAVTRLGAHLAQSLDTSLRLVGYLTRGDDAQATADSERLALQADAIRQSTGVWAVPQFAEQNPLEAAVQESAEAAVVLVGLGDLASEDDDFGRPASELAEVAACPVVVIRAAGQPLTTVTARAAAGRRGRRERVAVPHA